MDSATLSVLVNKISKANKIVVEYALAQPGEYGRTAQEIAETLEWWKAHRDRLVTEYNAYLAAA